MKSSSTTTSPDIRTSDAAKAANEATAQAKATMSKTLKGLQGLDRLGQLVIAASLIAAFSAFLFDMLSFQIVTSKPVTPTMADEMRRMEGMLNAHAYSAFASTVLGKLMMLGSLGAVGLLVWSHLTNQRAGWIPLAIAGATGIAAVCLAFIGMTGTPSQGLFAQHAAYLRPDIDLTLLGYWLPLAAAAVAAAAAVKRILRA